MHTRKAMGQQNVSEIPVEDCIDVYDQITQKHG